MAWDVGISRKRVADLVKRFERIDVKPFRDPYLTSGKRALAKDSALGDGPLIQVPPGKAITVDGVHIYVKVTGFNEYLVDHARETEETHRRALTLLHTLYGAFDRVVENANAQRVDYHGPRLHAVVLDPSDPREQLSVAAQLCTRLSRLFDSAYQTFYGQALPIGLRFGIDIGPAVALDSGRSDEHEPLFVGRPANHAAKLAEGSTPGIFVSPAVSSILGSITSERSTLAKAAALPLNEAELESLWSRQALQTFAFGARPRLAMDASDRASQILKEWTTERELSKRQGLTADTAIFSFHHHEPPLASLSFDELSPANSIRMELASMFADVDGYTPYVDAAIADGNAEEAVRTIYVIREELNNVLRADSQGRKVRFIGDCIHGLLAMGDRTTIDDVATVREAVACASAMQSAFDVCLAALSPSKGLGLAVGIEYGAAAISRIGIRGDRSVRCAIGRCVTGSEAAQQRCGRGEVMIAENAQLVKAPAMASIFGTPPTPRGPFKYADIARLLSTSAIATPAIAKPSGAGRSDGFRAHTSR